MWLITEVSCPYVYRRSALDRCKQLIRTLVHDACTGEQAPPHDSEYALMTQRQKGVVFRILNEVWDKATRLRADAMNRACRYYYPLIAEQSVLYIGQHFARLPGDQMVSKLDIERVLGKSCEHLIACIRAPGSNTAASKAEAFSVLRGFFNTFFVHGMLKLIREAFPESEERRFLDKRAAPLDCKGVDTLHRAIHHASICLSALSKGRSLVKKFSEQDRQTHVTGSDLPLSCCLEPPLMHTNFLRDTGFQTMRKCLGTEVATESAFVEFVMHHLVFKTFNKGNVLVEKARKKLVRIAGRERAAMLVNLVCEDEARSELALRASNTICVMWAAWTAVAAMPFGWIYPFNTPGCDTRKYDWETSNVIKNQVGPSRCPIMPIYAISTIIILALGTRHILHCA